MTTSAAAIRTGSPRNDGLEGLRVALEAGGQRQRLAELAARPPDRVDGVSERDARFQVERDRGGRKHALMIDDDRRGLDRRVDQRAQRHLLPARRVHVDSASALPGRTEICGVTSRTT